MTNGNMNEPPRVETVEEFKLRIAAIISDQLAFGPLWYRAQDRGESFLIAG